MAKVSNHLGSYIFCMKEWHRKTRSGGFIGSEFLKSAFVKALFQRTKCGVRDLPTLASHCRAHTSR